MTKRLFAAGEILTAANVNTYLTGTKNMLINAGFDIWQRGTSFTGTGYSADRWRIDSVTATTVSRVTLDPGNVSTFGLRLTATNATNSISLSQPLESFLANELRGQSVVLSFYASSSTALNLSFAVQGSTTANSGSASFTTFSGGSGTAAVSSVAQRFDIRVDVPSTSASAGLRVNFSTSNIPNSATVNIWNVQLEEGFVPSPFSTQTPSIATELLACQRYYWVERAQPSSPFTVFSKFNGYADSTTLLYQVANCPVPMRAVPTAVTFSNLQLFGLGGGSISALVINGVSTETSLLLNLTVTGTTAGRWYSLQAAANAAAYIDFTAEL